MGDGVLVLFPAREIPAPEALPIGRAALLLRRQGVPTWFGRLDAAYQHFEEDLKGSLEPGKLADFVVLSRSPLDEPEMIDEIEVLETWIDGEVVYRR